jgi:hypothetical protein
MGGHGGSTARALSGNGGVTAPSSLPGLQTSWT